MGDEEVAAVAGRQQGLITRQQLFGAGFSRDEIDKRVKRGSLIPRHRGVYAVGHTAHAPLAGERAALLAVGEDAFLWGRSAAVVWRLIPGVPGPIEVGVTGRKVKSRPGILVHRCSVLVQGDVTEHRGLPLMSLPLTLLSLAATYDVAVVGRALNEARVLYRLQDRALLSRIRRACGQRGAARLARLLDSEAGPTFTRSETERRLLRIVRAAGLPRPETNVRVNGLEVDGLWAESRLVLQVDAFGTHGTSAAFEADRRDDAILLGAGLAVIRVTWRQIREEPIAVAARIAAALAARRSPAA